MHRDGFERVHKPRLSLLQNPIFETDIRHQGQQSGRATDRRDHDEKQSHEMPRLQDRNRHGKGRDLWAAETFADPTNRRETGNLIPAGLYALHKPG